MNLITRVKRIWKLSKKDKTSLDKLTNEQIDALPDEDTRAVFISEGTHEDYEEQVKEDKGLKGIFGIGL